MQDSREEVFIRENDFDEDFDEDFFAQWGNIIINTFHSNKNTILFFNNKNFTTRQNQTWSKLAHFCGSVFGDGKRSLDCASFEPTPFSSWIFKKTKRLSIVCVLDKWYQLLFMQIWNKTYFFCYSEFFIFFEYFVLTDNEKVLGSFLTNSPKTLRF